LVGNEIYYLILVLGAFGAFSVAMIALTLKDKAYARRTAPRKH
jgi:hypothetical protein